MNGEILMIIDSIEREKGISKETLFAALESALASAARKILGKNTADIVVTIDRETGEIKVKSGSKKIDSANFGRIAAQTAKQVIIQKIREAERDVIFEEYTKRVGGIITGSVHRFERGTIIVELGKTEGILPKSQQCPDERYKQGDRIRSLLLEVTKTGHGPQIILSRSSTLFVKKLFELEVPEISEGIVEIKSISREAGERTKIAVCSKDEKVDPIGACVGMRGTRVKEIVKELHGEKIDIVRWNTDIREYLNAALSPAKISKLEIDKEKKFIKVIVKTDQLSLAIGKHGQNVRLASKLIGWELDIRPEEGAEEIASSAPCPPSAGEAPTRNDGETERTRKDEEAAPAGKVSGIKELDGVGKKAEKTLLEAGFDTIEKLAQATLDDLLKLKGIGKKTAEKIIASAKAILKNDKDKEGIIGINKDKEGKIGINKDKEGIIGIDKDKEG